MESGVPNSFIPQDATTARSSLRQGGGGLNDLFMLLSIVLCIASGALGAVAFVYNGYLQTVSTSKAQQIQQAQANFNGALIQQVSRLADRITASESILGTHMAPTAFFQALDQSTLSTVSFSDLVLDATDPQKITIKMDGVAQSVNSIALQADLFSKNGVISNPIFSGIDRQADGVHFSVTADVNPTAINYSQLLSQGQAAQQTVAVPAAQSAAALGSQPSAPVGNASSSSPAPSQSAGLPTQ